MKKTAKQLDFEFTKKVLDTPTCLLRGSVRGSDPIESQGAAIRALEHPERGSRRSCCTSSRPKGPQTAKETESRASYRALGPSTVRKRLSE